MKILKKKKKYEKMSQQNKTSFVITNVPSSNLNLVSSSSSISSSSSSSYQKFLSCPVCHRVGFKNAIETRDHVIRCHPEHVPAQYHPLHHKTKFGQTATSSNQMNRNNNNISDNIHQFDDDDDENDEGENKKITNISSCCDVCRINHGKYYPKTPARSTLRKLFFASQNHQNNSSIISSSANICNDCILQKFKLAYSQSSMSPLEI